jgi:hypothetical protein
MRKGAETVESEGNKEVSYKVGCLTNRAHNSHVQKSMFLEFNENVMAKPLWASNVA